MTNQKATQLPWRAEGGRIFSGDEEIATTCYESDSAFVVIDTDQEEANADLIVRAVNAYQPMLDALRGIEWAGTYAEPVCPACGHHRDLANNGPRGREMPPGHKADCTLSAAIAAAEGREAPRA